MIHSTIDFGRPYSDVVHKRGYWVMEELLHSVETWSVVIFQPYKLSGSSRSIPILHNQDAEVAKCQAEADHGFPEDAWYYVKYFHFQSYVDPQADVADACDNEDIS